MKTPQTEPGTAGPKDAAIRMQLVKVLSSRGIRIKESLVRWVAGIWACGFVLVAVQQAPAQDPVLTFNARFNGSFTKLYWTSAPDLVFNYFSVERSWNGKDFETIGLVAPQPAGPQFGSYAFTDKDYYSSIVYYRLRLVDEDNKSAVAGNIVALQLAEDAREFIISPCRDMPGAVYVDGLRLGGEEIIVDAVNREKQIVANGILKKGASERSFEMQQVRKLKPGEYTISAFFNRRVVKTKLIVKEPADNGRPPAPGNLGLEFSRK